VEHRTLAMLEAGLDEVREAPNDIGVLSLIVRRPALGEREVLDVGELDLVSGLVGDTWPERPSRLMPDGAPHPDKQLTVVNARVIQLFAGTRDRWALAGDQLYVDFDISQANLPPGTRVALGSAVIEFTDQPHIGCAKFAARFGTEALRFAQTETGRALRLRGANAKVVVAGTVRQGDEVRKLSS
jgi:hypothetical protein